MTKITAPLVLQVALLLYRPKFYKLKASIEENAVIIKRNVPNFNNIDVNLYTVTLEKLMDTVKADIYSDAMLDSPEMQN